MSPALEQGQAAAEKTAAEKLLTSRTEPGGQMGQEGGKDG